MAKSAGTTSNPTAHSAVIVIAGEEAFLRDQAIEEIKHAVLGDEDPGMALVRLDGNAPIANILDEARTPSMFAPRKLVIVEPADALLKGGGEDAPAKGRRPTLSNREILENYVESPSDSAVLVLVCNSWLKTTRLHKALDKAGAIRWCEPIRQHAAPAWITRRARERYGKGIEPAAAARLADLIGPDLARLDNELAKLSLYDPASASIPVKAVDDLVGFQHEQEIWDLINALSARDAKIALRKVDELWQLDPKIEYTAVGAIFSWLNQVLRAREMLDRRLGDGAIIAALKLWPADRATKIISLAKSWGVSGSARWSQELLRVDIGNKTSVGESRVNLEKFIVQLCE
jgi:DNA polymerase III subunit delta